MHRFANLLEKLRFQGYAQPIQYDFAIRRVRISQANASLVQEPRRLIKIAQLPPFVSDGHLPVNIQQDAFGFFGSIAYHRRLPSG